MSIAKQHEKGRLGDGNCPSAQAVDEGYEVGRRIGIRGTPALIYPSGKLVSGYRPAGEIIADLVPDAGGDGALANREPQP